MPGKVFNLVSAASADGWKQRDFVAFCELIGSLCKLVVASQDDAGCHLAQAGKCGGVVIENGTGGRAFGQVDSLFGVAADVFKKTEKQNPDLHYVKAIKRSYNANAMTARRKTTLVYMGHWLVAVPVSILLGAVPDQHFYVKYYYGTSLEGVPPITAAIGGLLGFFVNLWRRDRVACFIFVPALLLFGVGLYSELIDYRAERAISWRQYVIDNTFGIHPGCEGDCFAGIVTLPLGPSLLYSATALLALKCPRTPDNRPAR